MLSAQTSVNTTFQKPYKNDTGYYISKLVEPIILTLPKMEIHDNGKNEKGQYEIRYVLDINDVKFKQLIEDLYHLDEFALDTAFKNSKEWFGQEISKDVLENLYITPYEDEDDSLFIKLSIDNDSLLEKFNYEHYCIVEIKSLEFYRSSFKFVMNVKDVIIEEKEINDENKNVSLNFNELIEGKSVVEEVLEDETNNELLETNNAQETNNTQEETNNTQAVNDNEDDFKTQFIENVSRTTQNIIDENATQYLDTYSELSKQDVESIISTKREESRRCFLNAERAGRAANNLKKKALETASELKKYEQILDNFN